MMASASAAEISATPLLLSTKANLTPTRHLHHHSIGSSILSTTEQSPLQQSSKKETEAWEINPEAPLSVKFKETQKKFEVLIQKNSNLPFSNSPPLPSSGFRTLHSSNRSQSGDFTHLMKHIVPTAISEDSLQKPKAPSSSEHRQRRSFQRDDDKDNKGVLKIDNSARAQSAPRTPSGWHGKEPTVMLSPTSSVDSDIFTSEGISVNKKPPTSKLALAMLQKYSEQHSRESAKAAASQDLSSLSQPILSSPSQSIDLMSNYDDAVCTPPSSSSQSPPDHPYLHHQHRNNFIKSSPPLSLSLDCFEAATNAANSSALPPAVRSSIEADHRYWGSVDNSPNHVGKINLSLKERAKAALNLKLLQMSHKLISKMEEEHLASMSVESLDQKKHHQRHHSEEEIVAFAVNLSMSSSYHSQSGEISPTRRMMQANRGGSFSPAPSPRGSVASSRASSPHVFVKSKESPSRLKQHRL
mmetsp:Transcript_18860/g.25783  ORF Transcript_18860/g.25783 Transcript_18860/m.25783 type:complete len:470 (+) Transcript_18860:3-1412(+)